jgi:hypothetical protein
VSLAIVQQAILYVLQARPGLAGVPVTDAGPVSAEDLQNASGAFEAIWIDDARSDGIMPPVMGVPVWLTESYIVDLVIQVLAMNEGASSQLEANVRCDALLHEIIGALCADPTLGVASTASINYVEALPMSWEHIGGWLGGGDQRGSRYVLGIAVEVRLTLT